MKSISTFVQKKFSSLSPTKRNSIFYTGAQYGTSVFRFVQSFVLAKILGPALMGEVSAISLILTYGVYLQSGTYLAMLQKIPYLRGKGENDLAETYKDTAFSYTMTLSTVAFVGLAIYGLLADLQPIYRFGFIVFGATLPMYYLYNFNNGLWRCKNQFNRLAFQSIMQSVILLVFSISLVFVISNKAVILAMLLSYLITNIYTYKTNDEFFKFKIDINALKNLLIVGIPLILTSVCETVVNTADRIMILNYLDETDLGLYSFPAGLAAFYYMGGKSVSSVLYQKALLEFGKNEDESQVVKTLYHGVIVLGIISPLVGYGIEGAAFFLVDNFLPKYEPSKLILELLITPSIFMAVTRFFTQSLITVGKQNYILAIEVFLIGLAFGSNWLALEVFDAGLIGVTLCSGITLFGYFISMSFMSVLKVGNQSLKNFFSIAGKIISIFLLVICIKFIARNFMFANPLEILGMNFDGVVYTLISGSIYGLFVYLVLFKFKLIQK
ncbi:MAG: hypothetical protein DWQ06_00530 [Calditrichaeota bacterium]|nr:MAG: hypothetical protein DWQ06_00530 [Calditrichota bacterium]